MNDVSIGLGWESLKGLSDTALLAEVARVSRAHRVLTAELVAHLAEVDERKLYLSEATPSMFVYCVQRLGFSEDESCRRIEAARAARKWPLILGKIGQGELSLTVLGKLKPFLTDENVSELVESVSGLSVREAERVLAARFPKPDVADSIRKLPNRSPVAPAVGDGRSPGTLGSLASSTGIASTNASELTTVPNDAARGAMSAGADAWFQIIVGSKGGVTGAPSDSGVARNTSGATAGEPRPAARPVDRGSFQPLSAERIQVKFTASRELEEKLALARDLMSHRNPRGDLATIVEAGLDLLIAEMLKTKLGVTERAQQKKRPAKRERVTNATRREVLDRDGLGCAFVNEKGKRCGARAFLELDHRKSKGEGGGPEPENMRLLCRAHNQGEAERVYGKAHMERSRRKKRDDGVRERTSTHEFVVGLSHPRRRGSPSSAGRSKAAELALSVTVPAFCSAERTLPFER